VAGPIYKVARYCEKIRDANLGPIYPLRQGDQLQEFYHSFEAMHDAIRKRSEDEVRMLGAIIEMLERGEAAKDAAAQLQSLKHRHEVMLAGGPGPKPPS
jgi:hypothetical protein